MVLRVVDLSSSARVTASSPDESATSLPHEAKSSSASGIRSSSDWHHAMRAAVRDADDLIAKVKLPSSTSPGANRGAETFPVFVPPFYLSKIEPGKADDPLLRQVLPTLAETIAQPSEQADAVGDLAAEVVPGLIRKYRSRALLITTGACAVHCRYCFRREFPYSARPHSRADWAAALAQLADDADVTEIILSGGDPWTLADGTLADLIDLIATLPHVRRLRVHTRLPLMIPERITPALVAGLTGTRLTPIVVLHANHAREVCGRVAEALRPLREAGVTLLNQTVLLAGVNDDATALVSLSEALFTAGVLPYYLHHLDAVPGSGHFAIPVERGRELMDQLRARLPGYLVPRYVVEQAGAASKLPLDGLTNIGDSSRVITNREE